MSGSITGKWINAYQSKMSLLWNPTTGFISGDYTSHTGRSGHYTVVGMTPLNAAGPTPGGAGLPMALSLYWRPNGGTSPDPSWNWVSGLGGLLIYDDQGALEMRLIHNFVASNPLSGGGLNVEIGAYCDKLIYRPYVGDDIDTPSSTLPTGPDAACEQNAALVRTFTCQEDPAIQFTLYRPQNGTYVQGTYSNGTPLTHLQGLFNAQPTQGAGNLEAMSLSGHTKDQVSGAEMSISMAGWLDKTTQAATMTELRTTSQGYGARYLSTRTRTLTFK